MADERTEILGRVPLFEGLSEKELSAVANAVKERRYDTGDAIVSEGEGGVGYFVIAEGTARVEAHGQRVGTLGPGSSFGEVALLDEGGRRTASVIAEAPMRVFALTSWQFTPCSSSTPRSPSRWPSCWPAGCGSPRSARPRINHPRRW